MDINLDVDGLLQAALLYVPKVIGALLVLLIGFWLAKHFGKLAARALERRGTDAAIIPFVRSLVVVGIKVLVVVSAAGMFGVETASFIAMLGALTFAIGLALQGSLSHFASGILLLTLRPYKAGDVVEIAGQTGVVLGVQIFNTLLKTPENHRVIVPNGTVFSGVIKNLSGQETRGVTCTFGIGYDDDVDLARAIILRVAEECPHTLAEPAPAVFVTAHGDSAISLLTRPFASSADYWAAFTYMMEHVKKAFDAEGITIPYPQRDVHVHTS